MKRRKNQEGNYGTCEINGIKYKYYRAPNHAYTIYAKTAKELEIKRKIREQKETQEVVEESRFITVSELCEKWLRSNYKKIAPSTYDAYESIIEVRIKGLTDFDIGNKQASKVTTDMIEKYLKTLTGKYSKASINKTWVVLKQSLIYGQDHGYVLSDLNLTKVGIPKEYEVANKKKEIQFTSAEDMKLLYNEAYRKTSRGTYLYGDGARVLVFIMYSGVRAGEAIGLKWKYVAADYSKVRIMQTNKRVVKRDDNATALKIDGHYKYENIQKSPKTQSGERNIPLPKQAIDVLKYFSSLYPDHNPEDNVFRSGNGEIFISRNLNHLLHRMMRNCNCENKEYTLHSLRHGYGSILLSQGIDIKTVSTLLGHKDISTTYNIYIHVLEDDKERAVKSVFESMVDKC